MLSGVILAGGQNRRMEGKMKGLLSVEGESILERQIREMKLICKELILVTNHEQLFSYINTVDQIIADKIPGKGPLSGIHAAFSIAKHSNIWTVACDMPFISHEAAIILLEQRNKQNYDAAVPVIEGGVHPLHGVYKRAVVSEAEQALLSEEYKVTAFLDRLSCCYLHEERFQSKNIDLSFVKNINTPTEYNLL